YFAALHDIAGDKTNTIVFPLPMDLIEGLKPANKT
ncbi:MAG: slipin family protein, partial [Parvibaculum sp.]